jgi:hypothetical protein
MNIPDLITLTAAWLAVVVAVDWIWPERPKPVQRQDDWLRFDCRGHRYLVHFYQNDKRSLYDALERFALNPELDFGYEHMAAVVDELEDVK